MRRLLIAESSKMNLLRESATALGQSISSRWKDFPNIDLAIFATTARMTAENAQTHRKSAWIDRAPDVMGFNTATSHPIAYMPLCGRPPKTGPLQRVHVTIQG
jgi:hypothetical protein